ncbi:MAG: hypothetical protein QF463_15880 [Vicinamibacterales bacterium]|jgi:hypothetical protein|nr:hypothetical protein [Acidobacteriota bacterium]MDP6371965.1 hypothetical protein [Vicinamibacterales bacterium]MDP6610544.1 hypothetical protein [Vicinamibacterales bacterium]HAK55823.1 hypothetical protein [Acidobacteriota bacterium]|tara:strand:- start:4438 stop:5292 length:855 start_codon:yes stop_codon:yes gene_type:complete
MTTTSAFPWSRVAAVAAGFTLINELLIGPLFAQLFGLSPASLPIASRLGWALVSAFITVWALAFVARRVRADAEKLFVAFFIILAGLRFAAQAQAAYFFEPDVSAARFTGVLLQLLCASAVLAAAAAVLLGREAADPTRERPAGFGLSDLGWLWRIPAIGCVYLVFLLVAGLIIWPFVREFYAEHEAQQRLGLLFFEWEYLNGVLFALITLPFLRLVPGGWLRAGITAGTALCLIRGIGGLVVPSPYMPTSIRFWHMFEVGWSNFVYGLAIAYVFLPHARRTRA